MTKRHELIGGVALAVLLAFDAGAQQTPADLEGMRRFLEEQSKQLAVERRNLEEQEARLAQTRRVLTEHQRRLDALQAQIGASATKSAPEKVPLPTAEEPKAPAQVGQAPEIPALVETRGVLTRRNTFILEPSMQYQSTRTLVSKRNCRRVQAFTGYSRAWRQFFRPIPSSCSETSIICGISNATSIAQTSILEMQ